MWNIIIIGIVVNFVASFLLRNIRGVDVLPAFPIIAGYAYGPDAGFFTGAVIAGAYYVTNLKSVHYAPLTVTTSVLVGFVAGFLGGLNLIIVGISLLFVYHLICGFVVGIFGALKPGYFTFVIVNVITSLAVFYVSSFVL